MRLLIDAVVREELATDEEAQDYLMARFADRSIGLHLFEKKYQELAAVSPRRAMDFCEDYHDRMAQTAIGAMAYSNLLDAWVQADPVRFESDVSDFIHKSEIGRSQRIALVKRAGFYRDRGKPKSAVIDYLRLWSVYPQSVEASGLKDRIVATVREAGFVLEASALSSMERPSHLSARLYKEFASAVGEGEPRRASGEDSDSDGDYFSHAPQWPIHAESASADKQSAYDRAWRAARAARLAQHDRRPEAAFREYRAYANYVHESLSDGSALNWADLIDLSAIHDAVYESADAMFGANPLAREMRKAFAITLDGAELRQLTKGLGDLRVELREAGLSLAANDGPEAYASVIEELIKIFEEKGQRRRLVASLERFVEMFPESELAPTYLKKMARFYKEEWEAPMMAARVYERLIDEYPESAEAKSALLEKARSQYDAKSYGEALLSFYEYLSKEQNRKLTAAAEFYTALTEAELGMIEASEQRLIRLAQEHRDDPLAPAALTWLGSRRVMVQDYDGAAEYFSAIVERYPESEHFARAEQNLSRMKKK